MDFFRSLGRVFVSIYRSILRPTLRKNTQKHGSYISQSPRRDHFVFLCELRYSFDEQIGVNINGTYATNKYWLLGFHLGLIFTQIEYKLEEDWHTSF